MGAEVSSNTLSEMDQDLPYAEARTPCASEHDWTNIETLLQGKLSAMRRNHTMLIVNFILGYVRMHPDAVPHISSDLAEKLTSSLVDGSETPIEFVALLQHIGPTMYPLNTANGNNPEWTKNVIENIGRLVLIHRYWNFEQENLAKDFQHLFRDMTQCM